MKGKNQLCASIAELEGKIKFIKNYNIAELSAGHREKIINAIKVCNLAIDLILEKK